MLRSAASPGSRGVGRPQNGEWPPRTAVLGRPPILSRLKTKSTAEAVLFDFELLPDLLDSDLLDLGFLELDVLARDRVVLLLRQLVGHGPAVLLGDVEIASVGR